MRTRRLIAAILPLGAVAVERFGGDGGVVELYPQEAEAIAGSAPRRREQFAAGRACAREALAQLGIEPAALPPGLGGAPLWPAGTAGSITHCEGYTACAVARVDACAALGIDAEPDEPLPEGVCEQIATEAEREQLARLGEEHPGPGWDRLLFSAKEAAYKAWQAVEPRRMGFQEVRVELHPAEGTFDARLRPAGTAQEAGHVQAVRGRWTADSGLLLCVVSMPAKWGETA